MLGKAGSFVKDWTVDTIVDGLIVLGNGILKLLEALINTGEPLFVIAAIIGLLFVIAGNKRLGTKISSISILSYMILRAVF
jgi:hypothetical protein